MRTTRLLSAVLLAGVLALGACGGDDDDTADDADSTSTSTSTSTTDASDEEVASADAGGYLAIGDLRRWGSIGSDGGEGEGDDEVAGEGGEGEGDSPVVTTPEGVETFEPSADPEPTESEIPMFEG